MNADKDFLVPSTSRSPGFGVGAERLWSVSIGVSLWLKQCSATSGSSLLKQSVTHECSACQSSLWYVTKNLIVDCRAIESAIRVEIEVVLFRLFFGETTMSLGDYILPSCDIKVPDCDFFLRERIFSWFR